MSHDVGHYYVYMVTNQSRVVLNIGMTRDLKDRVYERAEKTTQSLDAREEKRARRGV